MSGQPFKGRVVKDHRLAVSGNAYVQFDAVTRVHGGLERDKGVFRPRRIVQAAVGQRHG